VRVLSRLREHRVLRYISLSLTIAAAILAAVVVSTLTVDLGPLVRGRVEQAGSSWLKRAVRIGSLHVQVFTGRVLLDDLSIDGRRPEDRPFFTAKRLSVSLDWSTALRRRPEFTVTSVELTDWQMLVEEWPDGHNFPKFTSDDASSNSNGPRRFTTTLRYLRAWRGQFTYQNHEGRWGVVAPNIDLHITKVRGYEGEAAFSGGTITIQDNLPMWANMKASFAIDGSRLHMKHIDIDSDGARSVAVGEIDLTRWPEMLYDVRSRVNFPRMREIFFRDEPWELAGDGDFTGKFHLFKGGHDLAGAFTSDALGVYAYRFRSLFGSLHWTRKLFEVTSAGSELYGGASRFAFSIKPLGSPERPTTRFDVSYQDVDLVQVSDFYELAGLRFAGSASGRNVLEWPLGEFARRRDEGRIEVTMPPGVQPMASSLAAPVATLAGDEGASAAARAADRDRPLSEWGPFAPQSLPAHVAIAGEVTYRFDGEHVELDPGRFATERTGVTFEGQTAWGDQSRFAFHVMSRDYQESDQILAGILTDFGSRTDTVVFGGRGAFDGVMTGAFRRPRIQGVFSGEDLRAWDTLWGAGTAKIVVENNYLTVADGVVRSGDSEIRAEGLFSLGYPRPDHGDEIDARFRVTRRDVDSLRHAFEIDGYPLSGQLTGEFHLTGEYEHPIGFGAMTVDNGTAYGEPFEKATSSLRLDGAGVRLDGVTITAKTGGAMTGAAYVGWDSTYSFNADARRFPVERLEAFNYPQIRPSGVIDFTAAGSGTFSAPRYDVRFRVSDVFVKDQSVGQVTGTLALRGNELTGEVDAASPRLAVTGTGRIALTPQADAELTLRFHDSSLDLPARLFLPTLSPLTTAVASGSIRVVGELADVDHLLVDATVDSVEMRLFDYAVRNAAPVRLALDQHVLRVRDLQLVGEDTRLTISGSIALHDQTIALRASGDANLAILQGFFRDVRGSGRAELLAAVDGPLHQPVFSGSATITDGRIRHFALPNSLDAINGVIHFDSRGLQLDDVAATLGGGRVQFGGRVGFEGYLPGELNVSVRGENMQLRYLAGVRSTVDADLTIRGNFMAPSVGGNVTVRSATWSRRVDPTGGLLDIGGGGRSAPTAFVETPASTVPVRLDVQVHVPSTLRVENNLARLVASADLQLRGTLDRPQLFGRAEVDRGEVTFEGRRYLVTKGAIEFTNPTRIDPFFDVEAETRVRVPGQTYRVVVRAAGTMAHMQPELDSDPPLPPADVLALLFSDVRRSQGPGDVELRARQNPNENEQDILATRATQLLANPISSQVGRVVEQTFGVDTFQLSPSLIDPYTQSTTNYRVNPSARVTIGKRVSERVYLTFSRSLSSSINDQILLLEYDESDRLSWILSRNEDSTYALEVRVRHAF
jgi:translocation-and-assembly-module (TAM) inner membrane subunit TamB-like protein